MQLEGDSGSHLTYCTNIHPSEGWPDVREILRRRLPAVKARVCADDDFGVGLRLAASAAAALTDPAALDELQTILRDRGLYVFTINGFPYGVFHGITVKTNVYRPDWLEDERLHYTNSLADLLARLLPDDPALEGSISTVPGAFKPRVTGAEARERIASQIVRHAAHLHRLGEETGRTIVLALEPEPCCFLETIAETVTFFEDHLFNTGAAKEMAAETGLGSGDAGDALRHHIGVCLDACHAAVEFESPSAAIGDLRRAGIRIAKLQLSAGLRIADMIPEKAAALRRFNDDVYLHQVVERRGDQLIRYLDLPEAFDSLNQGERGHEWRVHFHVPIFLEELGEFSSTQDFLRELLMLHRQEPISQHLEVETYTWDVLPEEYRGEEVEAAIARELDWVTAILSP